MNVLNTFRGSHYFLLWHHPVSTSPVIMFSPAEAESYAPTPQLLPIRNEGLFPAGQPLGGAEMLPTLGNGANPGRDSAAEGTGGWGEQGGVFF